MLEGRRDIVAIGDGLAHDGLDDLRVLDAETARLFAMKAQDLDHVLELDLATLGASARGEGNISFLQAFAKTNVHAATRLLVSTNVRG